MIKIYDSSLDKNIVVASNRGDKLYTKSINFANPSEEKTYEDSSIITIDEALNSISKEIRDVKEGVAWVYKNGTIGGGGGTGSGSPKFKVTTSDGVITDNSIIVNNNQTLKLTFTITGTSTGRKMNITIKDNKGNFYNYNNSSYTTSTKGTTIEIPNITNDLLVEFTGYDQETLSVIESYTLSIKVSTLKITGPSSVEISKSDTEYNIKYDIKTTYGQVTYIMLSTIINGIEYEYISETFITSQSKEFNIFNIFEGLNLEEILKGDNPINNMEIKAKVISGDYSDTVITSIVFTSENKISVDIIPINNITGEKPTYEYIENDNISFTIKLYFSSNEFYMYYKLYQLENDIENIVYEKGNINVPNSEENKISTTQFYSKNNPINIPYPSSINPNLPVYVYVKAWEKNNQSFDGDNKKWFGVKSDENWQAYNLSMSGLDTHIDGGLNYLYYEYNSKNFSNIDISDTIFSSRKYKGNSINETIVNGSIKYYNANNITNGVLLRGKSNENANTLRMSSNSYGILCDNNGNSFIPFSNNKNNWMNNSDGWTISLTFKSDTQANKDNVIFSCASFDNIGKLNEGIYITTTDINVRFTNSTKQIGKWNLSAKLSQNVFNQVDIVYIPKEITNDNNTKKIGELRIYINGVLSAAGIETNINFENNNYYPTISSNMTIGATHNGKTYSKYSDVNFYRLLFYKRALTPYHITKNLIQGKAEIELLSDGNIDRISNNELRKKNFFNSDGTCSIINKDTYASGTCEYVSNLYSQLSTSSDNPLPIILIKVDSTFKNVVNNRYTEDQVADDKVSSNPTITKEYDAVITMMKEQSNKQFIMGKNGGDLAIGDNSGKDCTVKLQGTSTLGNKSKNFEISFGASKNEDNTNKENLVQMFEDMLPENSWILKADVMDSGHANNAAIGGFINDFLSTYSTTANQMANNEYANEIKATTAGHPIILFMQFGDNAPQEFLGIYSLNLGRISYYNLGYQIFDGNYKVISSKNDVEKTVIYKNHKIEDTTIEFPALVSSYNSIPIPYNSNLSGVDYNSTTAVCYECKGNNNIVGTFQQSDNNVINDFYYRVYPNIDNTNSAEAFKRFRKLFVATSNLYECDPEYLCKMEEGDEYLKTRSLLARNSKGEFFNKETSNYETFNKDNYINNKYKLQDSWQPTDSFLSLTTSQTNENENHIGLNWDFASAYFTLAMLFGLTDSLGKNLNIRSFNLEDWYISFYDMDTGLGLTNAGYETVKDDVYLDRFSLNSNKQEVNVKINGYKEGGYDTINSRLFNIIRFFTNKEYTTTGTKPNTNYRKIWEDIRKTLLKNPNDFVDNYYIKQNKNVGEIIFNYDYDIKYVNDEVDIITNPNTNIKSGSINFLHGNRINFVRDWFNTHVFFLDGVFDIKCIAPLTDETKELYGNVAGQPYYGIISGNNNIESDQSFNESTPGVICPYISFSNQTDRVNPSFDGYKDFSIKSNIPMFFIYNNGTLNQRLFIDKDVLTNIELYFKSGNEQTMTFNYAPYLVIFDKFGTLSYVNMTKPNLSSITEIDLSNTKTLSGASFDISSLVELKKLNMNNTLTTSEKPLQVDLQNAYKISYIDLRNANVESLVLPGYGDNPGGSLEEIYIDKTTIKDVDLSGHAMLKKFSANECKNLSTLIFKYNKLLNDIGTIPSTISKIIFEDCDSLENINLSSMNFLTDEGFVLGKMEKLKSFTYSHNVSDEYPKGITKLDFSGCPNLQEINLPNFAGEYITLNDNCKNTLEKINISNSNIKYIIWVNENNEKTYSRIDGEYEGVLDFKECIKLNILNISGNKNIKYILLNEETVIEDINITYCEELVRIIGNIKVNVNKFKNLNNFRFNEICKYNNEDTTSNIILKDNGDVELEDKEQLIFNLDENINGDYIKDYNLNNLLTHYEFIEDGASLESSFSKSGINITDLYAILIKLSNWKSKEYISENNPEGYITVFDKTFANCDNIKTFEVEVVNTGSGKITEISPNSNYKSETEYIKNNIFNFGKYNEHLEKLISTFENCKNIKGYINDIFKPLNNIKNIENVFNGCGELYITDNIFSNNNVLEIINKPFSNTTMGNPYNDISSFPNYYPIIEKTKYIYGTPLAPTNLFKNNPNIEELKEVFSNTNVQFEIDNIEGKFKNIEDMFIKNTNIKTIYKLLPSVYSGKINNTEPSELDLSNIFGGYYRYQLNNGNEDLIIEKFGSVEEFNNSYPRKIENLEYAFAFDKTKLDEDRPTLKWDNLEYIFYNLYTEENGKYITHLKNCAYMFDYLAYLKDGDDYYDYIEDAKFPINIFNIKDENGNYILFDKLQSCEGLFMRASFKDTLYFPGNIFQNCTCKNLNLSHLLEDTYLTPIVLVNEDDVDENGNKYVCFNNCNLGNISSMFKNCFKGINKKDFITEDYYNENGIKIDKGGLKGVIPYKFFKNKGFITNMSNVFESCCHLGTKYDASGNFASRDEKCFYNIRKPDLQTVIDVSNNIKDVSLLLDLVEQDNNGNWDWSAWSYDGTIFEEDYLTALNNIQLNGKNYIQAKHDNIPNYIDLEWLIKEIPDTSILLNLDSAKCKFDNNNQIESLRNSYYDASYLPEISLSDGSKVNIYRVYYDADYDIKNVNFSNEYLGNNRQLWNCDSFSYLDNEDDITANYKHITNIEGSSPTVFIRNYMCPMDLFRYSSNTCLIDGIFKNVSRFNNDDKIEKFNGYVYGLIGRIPPKIFYPISNATSFEYVFENNKGIIPYAQSLDGEVYNYTFTNNKLLKSLKGLFKECMILGNLSNKLFNKNTALVNLSEIFKNSYMPSHYASINAGDDYRNFITKNIFDNTPLQNISDAFSRDNNENSYSSKNAYLYFDIDDNLLTVNKHSNLQNVSNLFAYQINIQRNNDKKDDIIYFEKWPYMQNKQGCYIGANFNMDKILKEMGGNKEE